MRLMAVALKKEVKKKKNEEACGMDRTVDTSKRNRFSHTNLSNELIPGIGSII